MNQLSSPINTDTQSSACWMGVSSGVLELLCHRLGETGFCANSMRDTREYPV